MYKFDLGVVKRAYMMLDFFLTATFLATVGTPMG